MDDPWWPLWLAIGAAFGLIAFLFAVAGLLVIGPPWLALRVIRAARARR